nr:MAG TPA: hypothetical protein [Bacteriophage sp.]DAX89134.1 MAG TPA: hypothetical protein [Caudoviricetes sp.]
MVINTPKWFVCHIDLLKYKNPTCDNTSEVFTQLSPALQLGVSALPYSYYH